MDGVTPPLELVRSVEALEGDTPADALAWACRYLNTDPASWQGLYAAGNSLLRMGYYGAAYSVFEAGQAKAPLTVNHCLNGMGMCVQQSGDYRGALKLFEQARLANPFDWHSLNNIGLCYLNLGNWEMAESVARQVIEDNPDCGPAYDNLSMSCLAQHKFAEGWEYAERSIGAPKREERIYDDEVRWDGSHVETVICYGEQGIGDEILFSSCIPDLIGAADNVIVDSKTRRLRGLFERSFPEATVINSKQDGVEVKGADARVSMAVLPKFFRTKRELFGKPHLKACPDRRRMVRALLDGLPGKKVGLAWTGGLPDTRGADRSTTFDSLYADLKDLNATFVSLEYKDADQTRREIDGTPVRHFPFLTNTQDYDDTAALVAELDMVVSVTTSGVHLAGGLGVPVRILVPDPPSWKYGGDGEDFYWWDSAKLIRQQKGEWDLTSVRREIDEG